MTPMSGYSNQLETNHGIVYFYKGESAAKALAQSLLHAEEARVQSQRELAQQLSNELGSRVVDPVSLATIIGAIAGTVGAAAAVAGTAAAVTGAGASVAGLVTQSEVSGKDSLEIQFENLTLVPVVLATYDTADSTSVSMPAPMGPGGEDAAVIVNSNGSFGKGDTQITMDFVVGGGVRPDGGALTAIGATCRLSYDSCGNWIPSIAIDSNSAMAASDEQEAFAAYFLSRTEGTPDFTIGTMGLEKGTAEAYFHFLPGSGYQS